MLHVHPPCGRAGRQDGGIVTGWLMQLVVVVAVLTFVGYELIAAAVNAVRVEDDAQQVARAAAQAYQTSERASTAEEAAEAEAQAQDVTLVSVEIEGELIEVTVRDEAETLVIHRFEPLDGLVTRTATSRVRWTPT